LPPGWYPSNPNECRKEIEGFVSEFTPPEGKWVGAVAPHAGWYFSGRAAARAIKALSADQKPDRVVVYGGHLAGGYDPIAYTDDAWETPLGPLTLDTAISGELVSCGQAVAAAKGYSDNTVEILLPLVKHFFGDAAVIAVHAPASDKAMQMAAAVHRLLQSKGLAAVYIGSADLTHYGPNYAFSPKGTGSAAVEWVKNENDRSLIDKALAMDAPGVVQDAKNRHNTCSAGPIAAVIAAAEKHGVKQGRLLEYYTSYDVMQNTSFVGYAAILY
jgi:hypothetical protein